MVERQFERKIKIFQSDGGGEFQKSEFLMHLSENGIVHQMSCPKTPEQNGVVERKHRHVVEHGLALLFHANVPKKYWVDAFMTSVFLINRTPSEKLKMKSPFSLLFGKEPDYSSLRVFGSRCFPYLREYAKNKFEPKSLPCVFLGYNQKHKGYRCLYPPTGRIFISRHVVFHEILFPFKKPADLFVAAADEGDLATFTDWVQATQNDFAVSSGHEEPFTRNQMMSPDPRNLDSNLISPNHLALQSEPILARPTCSRR